MEFKVSQEKKQLRISSPILSEAKVGVFSAIKMNKEELKAFITENYRTMPDREIAAIACVKMSHVAQVRVKMGISKAHFHVYKFKSNAVFRLIGIDTLKRLVEEGYRFSEIGSMVGLSRERIRQIAKDNNIKLQYKPKWLRQFKSKEDFLHLYAENNFSIRSLTQKLKNYPNYPNSAIYQAIRQFLNIDLTPLSYYGRRTARICPVCGKQRLMQISAIRSKHVYCSQRCRSKKEIQ